MFRIAMDILKIFVFLLSVLPFGHASDMLLDLRREHMFLNPTLNFVLKSPNFTMDNTTYEKDGNLIFNWEKERKDTSIISVQGNLVLQYKYLHIVQRVKFNSCVNYETNTIEDVAQSTFDEIYANFPRAWYRRFWTWLLSWFYVKPQRCPFRQYSIISPAHVKVEREKLGRLICNKWVKIEINLDFIDKNNRTQLITNSVYVGGLKCPDEKHSTGIWFWKRNTYLSDFYLS